MKNNDTFIPQQHEDNSLLIILQKQLLYKYAGKLSKYRNTTSQPHDIAAIVVTFYHRNTAIQPVNHMT